jgi:hypothetical protein
MMARDGGGASWSFFVFFALEVVMIRRSKQMAGFGLFRLLVWLKIFKSN